MRGVQPAACGCGGFPGGTQFLASPRRHQFWACPVAQALVDQLSLAGSRSVLCAEVWLEQSPESVQQCAWDVVVLAAVSAMECARRFMAAAQKGESALPPGPVLLERAIPRAVVSFWARLAGVCSVGAS